MEVHLALKLVHRHSTFETNLTGEEPQLAGGIPVGYLQVEPRSWAKDYLEKIQLVVRAGLERGISGFQVRHLDHSATLPSFLGIANYSSRIMKNFSTLAAQLESKPEVMWNGAGQRERERERERELEERAL